MFLCVLAIVISGYIYADGFSNIFQAARDGGRLEFWKYIINNYYFLFVLKISPSYSN